MAINYEKINQDLKMEVGRKRQLSLTSRKVPANPNMYHLIIGLGGSGIDATLEAKGLITQTCADAEKHVAYLAIDTDSRTRNKVSSDATGNARFEDGTEMIIMDDSGCADVFVQANIPATKANNPELFTWADETINPAGGGIGAEQNRQIGRLILYKNYPEIYNGIMNAINNLTKNASSPANARLCVYIVGGIGGGTGSGTFLDIGHITRSVLSSGSVGFAGVKNTVYAYFIMPDVNEQAGGSPDLHKRNAYAALQELDYSLSLQELGEQYTITYPGGASIIAGIGAKQLFDKTHLLSATNAAGTLLQDAYAKSMRSIAQNILSFVANEQGVTAKGQTTYHIESHYSNINTKATSILNGLNKHHRYSEYLAIGTAEYELPIDDIMMYVASLLFDNLKEMYDRPFDKANQPALNASVNGMIQALGWQGTQLINKLCSLTPHAQIIGNGSFEELKRDKWNWLDKVTNVYNTLLGERDGLMATAAKLKDDFCSAFDEALKAVFLDKKLGPVWAHKVIKELNKHLGDLQKALNENYVNKQPQDCISFQNTLNQYQTALDKLKDMGFMTKEDVRNKQASLVNDLGRAMHTEILNLSMAEAVRYLCNELQNYIQVKNSKLYDVVTTVLINLRDVFRSNAYILTRETEVVEGNARTFTWETLDIPTVKDVVKAAFDGIMGSQVKDIIEEFIKLLWTKGEEWMQDDRTFDPKNLVSSFIDAHFSQIAQKSLEEVLTALLAQNGGNAAADLAEGINNLMEQLISTSQPQYWPRNPNAAALAERTVYLISVPKDCDGIYNAVHAYCNNRFTLSGVNMNCILQQSDIRTRIYVQSVTCALPLSDFTTVWNAEEMYAQKREDAGLHLLHAVGPNAVIKRTWKNLYTLIPTLPEMRPIDISTLQPDHQNLLTDDINKKNWVKTLLGSGDPYAALDKGTPNWTATFTLTAPYFKIDGTKLIRFIRDGRTERILDTWDCVGLSEAQLQGLLDQMSDLLQNGLWTLPAAGMTTRTVGRKIYSDAQGADYQRTEDYLLEDCICRFELMRSLKREEKKYAVLRDYIQATQDFMANRGKEAEAMSGFAQMLICQGLYADYNGDAKDQMYLYYITGDLGAQIGDPTMRLDDPAVNYRLYQQYKKTMEDPQYEHLQRRLAAAEEKIRCDYSDQVLRTSEETRRWMLERIQDLNIRGVYDLLQRQGGASEKMLAFYETLTNAIQIKEERLRRMNGARPAPARAVRTTVAPPPEEPEIMMDYDE